MKNVLKVPQEMCLMDFLATQGDKIKYAWLFMEPAVYDDLIARCKNTEMTSHLEIRLKWEATEEYPSTEICIKSHMDLNWFFITKIDAEDIAFTEAPKYPEEVFFIVMDK